MHLLNRTSDLQRLVERRRGAFSVAATVMVGLEVVWPIATWPTHLITTAFYLYKLGWVVVIALACAFWTALYHFARHAGGSGYAFGYLLLSILLAPVLLGFALVPTLVERDIASGQAEWRRRNALDLRERVLRTVLYFLSLAVVAVPLGLLARELLLVAPVLAFFLQRLVLPWCRRAEPADGDGLAP